MWRRHLSALRDRAEGLAYGAIWHPSGGLMAWDSHRAMMRRMGLSSYRRAWWHQVRLEPYRSLWRYVRLLEWGLGRAGEAHDPQSPILPHGGRLLILRMGHLGDLLHLAPSIRFLRAQRPDIRIEVIVGPWCRDLARRFSCFDEVHVWTPDIVQYHRGRRDTVLSAQAERKFFNALSRPRVDALFCPSVPHFAELALIVGLAPVRYIGGDWPLNDLPVQIERLSRPSDSRRYEAEAVADFLPLMGLGRPDVRLAYEVKPASREKVRGLLSQELEGDPGIVSIFPGSGWPDKCWPAERFAELADRMASGRDIRIVLAGSPDEQALCERVRTGMKSPAFNLAGRLTLDESAALIEQSRMVIGNDSAPIHIAAALGIPTVSLWGPTFPEKWAPRGELHAAVRGEKPCAGCLYWHVRARCREAVPCIQSIGVDAVTERANSCLERSA